MALFLKLSIIFGALFCFSGSYSAQAQTVTTNMAVGTSVRHHYRGPAPYARHNYVYRHVNQGAIGWYGWHTLVNGRWYWPNPGYTLPVWWAPYGYSYYGYYGNRPYYASYGVIAYSPTTQKWGVSWGKLSRSAASADAKAYCAADDCAPVAWTRGGCVAIATDKDGQSVSWGLHTAKHGARSNAMRACRRSGATKCVAKAWVCSR